MRKPKGEASQKTSISIKFPSEMEFPKISVVSLVLSCAVSIVLSLELASYPLPGYYYPSTKYVTVSGTETGGIFAQMFHISRSYRVKGCAVYSATFYRCGPASGNTEDFRQLCTKNSDVPPESQYTVYDAVGELQTNDATHVIDSLDNLRNSRLYVYCGLQNPEFSTDQQLAVVALYEKYLASPYLIYTRVQDTEEQLRVIDVNYPDYATCPKIREADGTVSINCTNLSAPAEALGFLLGEYMHYVNPFYPHFRYIHLEPLRTFNQTEFFDGSDNTGLDEAGYFYIPRYCQSRSHAYRNKYGHKDYSKPCLVHIYFHGCNQGREFQGTSHVMKSNYLQVAELNYIIMLFPQALSSEANPGGCFDYVGFTGVQYATKNGPQIQAVWRMLERLLNLMPERTTSTYYRAGGRAGGGSSSNKYISPPKTNYEPSYTSSTDNKYKGCTAGTCGVRPPYFR